MGLERVSHIATGFTGWVDDGFAVQTYDDWKDARKK